VGDVNEVCVFVMLEELAFYMHARWIGIRVVGNIYSSVWRHVLAYHL